jgi:hypothetical protein
VIAIETTVSAEIEVLIVKLPLDVLQWQLTSATVTNDAQNGFGLSHLASLSMLVIRSPVLLRHVRSFPALRLLRGPRHHRTRVP